MAKVRGRKVYTLFGPETMEGASGEDRRGRNPGLIEQRNEHLLYRFAWYRTNKRNSFEWMIKQLAREFYLTECTVGHIIEANADVLHRIREEKISEKGLKRKYKWFVWGEKS